MCALPAWLDCKYSEVSWSVQLSSVLVVVKLSKNVFLYKILFPRGGFKLTLYELGSIISLNKMLLTFFVDTRLRAFTQLSPYGPLSKLLAISPLNNPYSSPLYIPL